MDDLEFRKNATIAPGNSDPEFLAKKNESQHNQRFVEEQLTFNNKLLDTLAITTPENLADRIILSQQLSLHKAKQTRQRTWLYSGIAASVFAIAISLSLLFPPLSNNEQLGQQIINHIYQDTQALDIQMSVPKNNIDTMLASYGGKLDGPIGQVSYLGHCIIGAHTGIHMVLNTSHGQVTVMLLPSQDIDHSHSLSDSQFRGLLYPTGKGSIAIVSEKAEAIPATRQRLDRNLNWII